jgi:hypothetical protein
MTIAAEFQQRCEDFPQNAANFKEFVVAILEEIHAASTEFHMVEDGKTLFAFAFQDGSAMTAVNCKGLRFALLNAGELKAIRKARHLTKKDVQDLALVLEAEPQGPKPDDESTPEARGSGSHVADDPEAQAVESQEQAEAWTQWDREKRRLKEDEEVEAERRERKADEDEAEIQREM